MLWLGLINRTTLTTLQTTPPGRPQEGHDVQTKAKIRRILRSEKPLQPVVEVLRNRESPLVQYRAKQAHMRVLETLFRFQGGLAPGSVRLQDQNRAIHQAAKRQTVGIEIG